MYNTYILASSLRQAAESQPRPRPAVAFPPKVYVRSS